MSKLNRSKRTKVEYVWAVSASGVEETKEKSSEGPVVSLTPWRVGLGRYLGALCVEKTRRIRLGIAPDSATPTKGKAAPLRVDLVGVDPDSSARVQRIGREDKLRRSITDVRQPPPVQVY